MTDWLKYVGMIFYAPMRGMREVRDRGGLGPAVFCSLLINGTFVGYLVWTYLKGTLGLHGFSSGLGSVFLATGSSIFVAIVFVPLALALTNTIEHRASYRLLFQQEYASVASTCLYAMAVASLIALVVVLALRLLSLDVAIGHKLVADLQEQIRLQPDFATAFRWNPTLLNERTLFGGGVGFTIFLVIFGAWAAVALNVSLRLSVPRSLLVVLVSGIISLPVSYFLLPLFSTILASPFLLLMLFFLLRGYFTGVVSNQRARAAFKHNLEAATINPRDSSAHYNLGLIHQQRGELGEGRERFQRAIEIDSEEVDAYYQLGRIARAQGRLAEAIGQFEQVVARDQFHALNEIWREIGSTYIAAGQYADARDALQRFLDRRENDPEGLYLMGRAHAGLGDNQEAASSMQACIDAVKTAPAYKYRTEKRWLNEAQQFLKGKRQEAVGGRH
jgi:Tfp pilus assembly protein PilF